MKKIALVCSLALLLTACGDKEVQQKTDKSETSQAKTTKVADVPSASSAQSAETTVETTAEAQEQTTAEAQGQTTAAATEKPSHKGDYFAVQGKYDEIIIVNKKHPLSSTYAPGEVPVAQSAFLKLKADMQAQGLPVSDQYSGFRSYETQDSLYQAYVAQDGQAEADRYSARPGYSEHQTGLAYDLVDTSGQLLTDAASYAWLQQHAPSYGFVIRYMEGKEGVTGYMAETWHLRYVGQEAVEIAASGLTLEEYFGVEGGGYPN